MIKLPVPALASHGSREMRLRNPGRSLVSRCETFDVEFPATENTATTRIEVRGSGHGNDEGGPSS